jgi:hypothetical protein
VCQNRVLRRMFGPKRDEVTGDRKKLHNEELHNLYFSPNIIRMIKSRRMRQIHGFVIGDTVLSEKVNYVIAVPFEMYLQHS